MIYDRDYMQPEHDPRDAAVARPLIIAVVVAFVLQAIVVRFVPGGADFLLNHVCLSLRNLAGLQLWTLLTYPFVVPNIDPFSVLWIVLDAFMIHMFGRVLVPLIGKRGFWQLTAGSVVLAGLVSVGVAAVAGLPGFTTTASVIVSALFTLFACIHPNQPIGLLFLPIAFKPKHLIWFFAGLSVFGLVIFELPGSPGPVPPSNLLGGMLAAWLYFRLVHRPGAVFQSSGPAIEMPAWMRRKKKKAAVAATATAYTVNVSTSSPADIRAEVDRILDKINSKGFGALTADERRILDEARDTLNKR